jgi:hypothetical protein
MSIRVNTPLIAMEELIVEEIKDCLVFTITLNSRKKLIYMIQIDTKSSIMLMVK